MMNKKTIAVILGIGVLGFFFMVGLHGAYLAKVKDLSEPQQVQHYYEELQTVRTHNQCYGTLLNLTCDTTTYKID
jgi:hypothetical protein